MLSGGHGTRPVVIVFVSEDDAYTYQRRSGHRVTPELLAAYWSTLLSDYWPIMIADEPPARLTSLHEGEVLIVAKVFALTKLDFVGLNLCFYCDYFRND